jgi:YVTN family beta-propeller protein
MKLNLSAISAVVGLGLATLLVAGGGLAVFQDVGAAGPSSEDPWRIVQDGVAVELSVAGPSGGDALVEGQDAEFTLALTDAKTGEPIPGLTLAAWVDRETSLEGDAPLVCRERISSYIQADLKTRPVLDLNSYVVLALNEGPTISVIDPFLGFGTTNLYARVNLPGAGEDWAVGPDQRHVFVTLPELDQVAVVSTDTWRVESSVDVGTHPRQVEFQPDGQGVWVLDGGTARGEAGVTVIDPSTLTVKGRIPTGAGNHTLAFSEDGGIAYVTNLDAGTVSVIDVAALAKLADVETGPRPAAVSYASEARAAYVVDEVDGSVTAIDRATHSIRMRVVTNPGLTAVSFDPMMGRWGIVLNTRENLAHIVDGMRDEIVHTVETPAGPDQISFTHNFAYIRALGSADVTMVPLSALREGYFDQEMWPFPAGALPPGAYNGAGPAAAVVPSPEMHDAVYVANPGEGRIYVYHYMEGMPTPSGTLNNYGERPRAVLTVGRTIHEESDGVYQTTVKAPNAGEYDFVFLLEDPRIIHCFDFDVQADPDKLAEDRPLDLELRSVEGGTRVPVGEKAIVTFELWDRATGEIKAGVPDVHVLLASTSGWQRRLQAERRTRGNYRIEVEIPAAGVLYLSVASPSLGVGFNEQAPLILHAVPGG